MLVCKHFVKRMIETPSGSHVLANAAIASIAGELRLALRLPETIGTRALGILARRHARCSTGRPREPREAIIAAAEIMVAKGMLKT